MSLIHRQRTIVFIGVAYASIYIIVSIFLVYLLQNDFTLKSETLLLNRNISVSEKWIEFHHENQISGETVAAMALGYTLNTYQMFVGSLRYTGYKGNIMIGLQNDAPMEIESYLVSQRCIIKYITLENCTTDESSSKKCVASYPETNRSWVRYRLLIDWLESCDTCVGPVLLTDVINTFFQANPFNLNMPISDSLFLLEDGGKSIKKTASIYSLLSKCKSFKWDVSLVSLCIILGERDRLLYYLRSLTREVRRWEVTRTCNSDIQSIALAVHNYLFYDGKVQAHINDNVISLLVDEHALRDRNGFFVSNDGIKVSVIRYFTIPSKGLEILIGNFTFITSSIESTYLKSPDSIFFREINGDIV